MIDRLIDSSDHFASRIMSSRTSFCMRFANKMRKNVNLPPFNS